MPKTYLKISKPGRKLYYALLQGKLSRRSFKTATLAEEYAAAWKERYRKLKQAAIKVASLDGKGDCIHVWEDMYYGVKCSKCGLFYPNGCEPWAPLDNVCDDDDPDSHSLECTCETCIQNYPERMAYDWEDVE